MKSFSLWLTNCIRAHCEHFYLELQYKITVRCKKHANKLQLVIFSIENLSSENSSFIVNTIEFMLKF